MLKKNQITTPRVLFSLLPYYHRCHYHYLMIPPIITTIPLFSKYPPNSSPIHPSHPVLLLPLSSLFFLFLLPSSFFSPLFFLRCPFLFFNHFFLYKILIRVCIRSKVWWWYTISILLNNDDLISYSIYFLRYHLFGKNFDCW